MKFNYLLCLTIFVGGLTIGVLLGMKPDAKCVDVESLNGQFVLIECEDGMIYGTTIVGVMVRCPHKSETEPEIFNIRGPSMLSDSSLVLTPTVHPTPTKRPR